MTQHTVGRKCSADQRPFSCTRTGNSFCIPPFCSASQQRTTYVSSPSACMCVRRSMQCAGAPTCWRAPCLPTCPASASPPASPYPTPGYVPTRSLAEKSKAVISVHYKGNNILIYRAMPDKLFACVAQLEDCGIIILP